MTFKPLDPSGQEGEAETKIVLLAGFSDQQLHAIIDAYKSNPRLPKAIFAAVTDQSKNIVLKNLLEELKTEARQLQQR